MSSASLIDEYRAVHTQAQQMLESARQGAWPEVSTIATQIAQQTDLIRSVRPSQVLESCALAERATILMSLIQIDNEVRQLREPWIEKLDSLLGR